MAGYIGTQAVSVNTTSATISDDLAVGDDLTVTDDATIGGTALVTGVLTTTAATVFNGGFAANDGSTISTADNTVELTLTSTSANANSGPIMNFYRNSASPAAGDSGGLIEFIGKNDAGEDVTNIQIEAEITGVGDGAEDVALKIGLRRAGAFVDALSFDGAKANGDPAETVFNDTGADINFRVESDGNANMLFVDGGNNAVVVGANDADTTISGGTPAFQVIGTGVATGVAVTRRENNAFGSSLYLSKSRNTTPDAFTVVQAGDTLGSIIFIGDDGTNLRCYY